MVQGVLGDAGMEGDCVSTDIENSIALFRVRLSFTISMQNRISAIARPLSRFTMTDGPIGGYEPRI